MDPKAYKVTAAGVAALFALSLAMGAGSALAADITDANAFEKSATASTAADHQALAAYFTEKAAEAGKEAELHQKMLTASMSGRNYAGMQPHCKKLISANEDAQKAYKELADLHAKLAKDAK